MARSSVHLFCINRNPLGTAIRIAAIAGSLILSLLAAPQLRAQSPRSDWEKAAGGKMSFEVASVKANKSGAPPSGPRSYSNISLSSEDDQPPVGSLFSATNVPLVSIISFAYKLTLNDFQSMSSQLPKWTAWTVQGFDIQARAAGSPTKDQFRLMMQALLADRFKFAMHYEVREIPLYNLVLTKPGKMGSQLRLYANEEPCPATPAPDAKVAGGYPADCGTLRFMTSSQPGQVRVGGRNMSISMMATSLSALGSLDRPVFDRTGLAGNIDFIIEWDRRHVIEPTAEAPGLTFPEALQDQLGLKLDAQKGPVNTFVVDHIEQPSEN
jgi:bla regulator protein blaR1